MSEDYLQSALDMNPDNQHLQFRIAIRDLGMRERLVYFALLAFDAKCSEGVLREITGLDRLMVRTGIERLVECGLFIETEDGYEPTRIIEMQRERP